MAAKTTQKAPLDQELVKAKAREQVASRKLDRLKDRYEKLKVITDTHFETHSGEREKLEQRLQQSQAQIQELSARCQSLQDEAAMWKSQLFDQLDRSDAKHQEFLTLQTELAEAQWQMVELINEERTRCETERAKSEVQVDLLGKELIAARARVDGLKNLGTCLTAKLERATAQRKVLQREHARLAEQAEARAQLLESKDDEIEELRVQLFEARRQILTQRLDSQSWEVLKEGLASEPAPQPAVQKWEVAHLVAESPLQAPRKPEGRRQLKLAPIPSAQSSGVLKTPRQLFQRATKTMGGWFKLGSKN
jgi:chromosome segregation ATPase